MTEPANPILVEEDTAFEWDDWGDDTAPMTEDEMNYLLSDGEETAGGLMTDDVFLSSETFVNVRQAIAENRTTVVTMLQSQGIQPHIAEQVLDHVATLPVESPELRLRRILGSLNRASLIGLLKNASPFMVLITVGVAIALLVAVKLRKK